MFNIPALVALTADQTKRQIGQPLSDTQESISEQIYSLRYRQRGYDLSVDYEVESRRVTEFYVNPHRNMRKPTALLQATNTTLNDERYVVEYLMESDSVYNGITIIPKNARVQDEFGNWVPRYSVR